MKEFRGLVIMPIEHQCAHINALHMVTKKPGSAEEMRNLECFCGANAKWFEENEKADLTNKQADAKFKEDTARRLGILKDAVRSMEEEIYGAVEAPSAKNP
jgi:hypothetical protein